MAGCGMSPSTESMAGLGSNYVEESLKPRAHCIGGGSVALLLLMHVTEHSLQDHTGGRLSAGERLGRTPGIK